MKQSKIYFTVKDLEVNGTKAEPYNVAPNEQYVWVYKSAYDSLYAKLDKSDKIVEEDEKIAITLLYVIGNHIKNNVAIGSDFNHFNLYLNGLQGWSITFIDTVGIRRVLDYIYEYTGLRLDITGVKCDKKWFRLHLINIKPFSKRGHVDVDREFHQHHFDFNSDLTVSMPAHVHGLYHSLYGFQSNGIDTFIEFIANGTNVSKEEAIRTITTLVKGR